ncbi:MAG TPA: NADH-quinone oxidoreductase subunit NuoB [Negativicutes bacterium]|nr:NADH-quinone oxidoreductase subunit NuoB [Negativicutes bacterium]
MLEILKKIMAVGTVTENWDAGAVPERFRGRVAAAEAGCACCGACRAVCPVGAITVDGDGVAVDQRACIFCGRCVERCERNLLTQTGDYRLAELGGQLLGEAVRGKIIRTLGRSLHIRHLDVGSCNACDFELGQLLSPVYDLQQYGIDFVASPRHADLLMVTGVVTRNLTQALLMTYEATPAPRLVMAVGACAASGRTFGESYAIRGGADALVPVDIYVPGCPPRPQAILYGLLLAIGRIGKK